MDAGLNVSFPAPRGAGLQLLGKCMKYTALMLGRAKPWTNKGIVFMCTDGRGLTVYQVGHHWVICFSLDLYLSEIVCFL